STFEWVHVLAPSTKQWHQFTIARSLQQCPFQYVGVRYNDAARSIEQAATEEHFSGTRSDRNPGFNTCYFNA
ncbi:hypothetical protein, partial [Erwinia sp. 198]|uniref:hypothetical protein n=1 Tax=Erwinia sp. 198 TaxID=2022746 RepID=UPI001F3DCD58